MIKNIGSVLTHLREEKGLSQTETAKLLSRAGINVTNQAVSKWENDTRVPNAYQLIELCCIYGVRDVLSVFSESEDDVLELLNKEGKQKVREYIRVLEASGFYRSENSSMRVLRKLPLYNIAVSAGTGQFLDSSDYELMEVGEEVPVTANFGVRLAGDSMEPVFYDGQIVWVQQQQVIESGETGIFLYDGQAYCKILRMEDEHVSLVSANPKYAPIKISGETSSLFRVFGKVVG